MTRDDERAPSVMKRGGASNLKPCRPGETANPRGRPPRKRYISEALSDLMGQDPSALEDDPVTVADLLAQAVTKRAAEGNVYAFETISNRLEGKPGIAGSGAVGTVAVLLSLPDRDTPLDELPGALEASTADLRAALLAEARGGDLPEPLPLPAAREAEDEPEGGR